MKKLTILASVAMVACAVNAASFTWGFGGGEYYDQNGAELYTGTAFLYLGTVTASETAFNTSGATLLMYGGFDNNYWAYGNPDADNLSSSASVTETTAGQDYTLILLNKENATSLDGYQGYYTLITGSSAEEAIPGATVVKYASFTNYDAPITTSTLMVPEPTSGLLMLLGMAGLALKRKRA